MCVSGIIKETMKKKEWPFAGFASLHGFFLQNKTAQTSKIWIFYFLQNVRNLSINVLIYIQLKPGTFGFVFFFDM